MGAILSLSLSGPSDRVFLGFERGWPKAPGQLCFLLGEGMTRTRTPTMSSITRGTRVTGPHHTAPDNDGDCATRDSDSHAHPARDRVALTCPRPRPLRLRRQWHGGKARDGRWDADRGPWGPGYPARLGIGPGPVAARATHTETGPAAPGQAQPEARTQPKTACTRMRCVTRIGPGPDVCSAGERICSRGACAQQGSRVCSWGTSVQHGTCVQQGGV
jgi:hypothetical protein